MKRSENLIENLKKRLSERVKEETGDKELAIGKLNLTIRATKIQKIDRT